MGKKQPVAEFVPIKMEFLKWVIIYVTIMTTSVLTNSYTLMWYTKDLSAMGTITVVVLGWFTSVIGLYTWKARLDHEIGYRHGYYKSGMSVDDVIKMTSNKNEEEE